MTAIKLKSERGEILLEFALVFPVLLLFFFGLLQMLLLINDKTVIEHAAFNAARSAAVWSGDYRRARRLALAETALIPGFDGRLSSSKVAIDESGGEIRVRVTAAVPLLPLIGQVVRLSGGRGVARLSTVAVIKKEPYWGGR